jgi:hypothetical protein
MGRRDKMRQILEHERAIKELQDRARTQGWQIDRAKDTYKFVSPQKQEISSTFSPGNELVFNKLKKDLSMAGLLPQHIFHSLQLERAKRVNAEMAKQAEAARKQEEFDQAWKKEVQEEATLDWVLHLKAAGVPEVFIGCGLGLVPDFEVARRLGAHLKMRYSVEAVRSLRVLHKIAEGAFPVP